MKGIVFELMALHTLNEKGKPICTSDVVSAVEKYMDDWKEQYDNTDSKARISGVLSDMEEDGILISDEKKEREKLYYLKPGLLIEDLMYERLALIGEKAEIDNKIVAIDDKIGFAYDFLKPLLIKYGAIYGGGIEEFIYNKN